MRNKLLSTLLLILLLISNNVFSQAINESAAMPVPDKDRYAAFLMEPWKDGAPTIIAFKDPLCGYCIKALKARSRLENYNVFLFWSPILGNNSKLKVQQIFLCEAPVSDDIMDAVMLRKNIPCHGETKEGLKQLNDNFVTAYSPRFVPQYWYGGQQTDLARLDLRNPQQNNILQVLASSTVKIPWTRYQPVAVSKEKANKKANIAIVFPGAGTLQPATLELMKRDKQLNWFVFDESTAQQKLILEFKMLNNITDSERPVFILEGKPLSEAELAKVLSKNLYKKLAEQNYLPS